VIFRGSNNLQRTTAATGWQATWSESMELLAVTTAAVTFRQHSTMEWSWVVRTERRAKPNGWTCTRTIIIITSLCRARELKCWTAGTTGNYTWKENHVLSILETQCFVRTARSCLWDPKQPFFICCGGISPRGSLTVGHSLGPQAGRELLYDGHIYLERHVDARYNIYFGRHFAWLQYFTYQLVPVLAPNCKQLILTPAKVWKVCHSLAEL
jgi:hypothetical protein